MGCVFVKYGTDYWHPDGESNQDLAESILTTLATLLGYASSAEYCNALEWHTKALKAKLARLQGI